MRKEASAISDYSNSSLHTVGVLNRQLLRSEIVLKHQHTQRQYTTLAIRITNRLAFVDIILKVK